MWRIRDEQMLALAQPVQREIEARVRAEYAEAASGRRIDGDTTERHVRFLIGRATKLGLDSLPSLVLHALLAARFGPKFDEEPRVCAYLRSAGDDVDTAFAQVVSGVPADVWCTPTDASWKRDWAAALGDPVIDAEPPGGGDDGWMG